MPIYNGYPQVYYPQQPQGQLEQLKAAADAPGGELAADLLQKLQQPCNLE